MPVQARSDACGVGIKLGSPDGRGKRDSWTGARRVKPNVDKPERP